MGESGRGRRREDKMAWSTNLWSIAGELVVNYDDRVEETWRPLMERCYIQRATLLLSCLVCMSMLRSADAG